MDAFSVIKGKLSIPVDAGLVILRRKIEEVVAFGIDRAAVDGIILADCYVQRVWIACSHHTLAVDGPDIHGRLDIYLFHVQLLFHYFVTIDNVNAVTAHVFDLTPVEGIDFTVIDGALSVDSTDVCYDTPEANLRSCRDAGEISSESRNIGC